MTFSFSISSAQKTKTFKVEAGSSVIEAIPFNEIYHYPAFTNGMVYFKDGLSASGRLNYHLLDDDIKFIDPKGDTLGLANETTIKFIAINNDTFYYNEINKGYFRKIGGNNIAKLAIQETLREVAKEQISSYGQPTSTSGNTSYSGVENNKSALSKISPKYNHVYTQKKQYYLGDRKDNFVLFNEKNLLKMFGKAKNDLNEYLKNNKVDFDKEEDLQKLTKFLETVRI
jgi:hypothetical protein